MSANTVATGGQSSSFRPGIKSERLISGRSGEIMRTLISFAAASVSSAMVRELGQPWKKITGAPAGSPYS